MVVCAGGKAIHDLTNTNHVETNNDTNHIKTNHDNESGPVLYQVPPVANASKSIIPLFCDVPTPNYEPTTLETILIMDLDKIQFNPKPVPYQVLPVTNASTSIIPLFCEVVLYFEPILEIIPVMDLDWDEYNIQEPTVTTSALRCLVSQCH